MIWVAPKRLFRRGPFIRLKRPIGGRCSLEKREPTVCSGLNGMRFQPANGQARQEPYWSIAMLGYARMSVLSFGESSPSSSSFDV
jgi:hypothetical protein